MASEELTTNLHLPTRLRIGLAQSKNVMAVRVLREVGLDETREYLTRFGFKLDQLPRSETIALGAGSLTPVQMAQGFSVFANNGYFVEPFYISRVENPFGNIEFSAEPKVVCHRECSSELDEFAEQDAASPYAPKVISEQNAFLTREMLYSNIWGGGEWSSNLGWNGTGWRAQALKRRDIGGKTGTTNDSKDAWYNGYAPGIVGVAWVGFDDHSRNLGKTAPNRNIEDDVSGAESGGKTALPAWVEFMSLALQDVPVQQKAVPNNIARVRIDRDTGLLTNKLDSSSMFEYFEAGTEPTEYVSEHVNESIYSTSSGEELF